METSKIPKKLMNWTTETEKELTTRSRFGGWSTRMKTALTGKDW